MNLELLYRQTSGGPGAPPGGIDHLSPYAPDDLHGAARRLGDVAQDMGATMDAEKYHQMRRDLEVAQHFIRALKRAVDMWDGKSPIVINPANMEITTGLAVAKPKEEAP